MPTIVDSLVLAFGLDSRQLDKGIQQTSANIKREADKLDAALGNKARGMANNFLAPFKQMIAPLMGALSLGAAVGQYASAADAVGKLSDAIGVNMEDLQAWSEAAARAGGSVQGFQTTIQSFNARLQASAAKGSDETSKMLAQLGVKATDASGKARDAFDVLRDMASSAEGLNKAEFKGLAEKLGIDRGTIMLLQSGRKSLDELIQRQKELGVYTKEDAEIAAKFNDATADMMQVIKAASAGVMRVLIPAITWLTEKLTVVVGFFRNNSQFVVSTLGVIAGILSAKLVPAMFDLAKAGARAMAPFAPFIALAVGLGLVIDDLWAYIEGGDSVLSELWSEFGTGEEISKALSDAWNFLKGTAVSLFFIIKPVLKGIADAFKGLSKFLAGFVEWLRAVFNGDMQAAADAGAKVWEGFKQIISAVWTALQNVVKNALKAIIGFILGDDAAEKFGQKWDAAIAVIEKVWNAIRNAFKTAIDFITGLFTTDTGASLFTASWDGVTKFFDDLWKSVTGIFEDGYKAVMKIWNMLVGTLMKGVAFVKNLWKGLTGGVKETTEFYAANADTDWEDLAERAANGEDVSGMYKPRPADGISQGGLNAADGKTEQTVNNTTDIKFETVNVTAQSSDPAALSKAFVDGTSSKFGSLVRPMESGTRPK